MASLTGQKALFPPPISCTYLVPSSWGEPQIVSPFSVQFNGEINDALPRKRHQKRHLEFCTAYLLRKKAKTPNALLSVAYGFSLLKSRLQLYRSYTEFALLPRLPAVYRPRPASSICLRTVGHCGRQY